MYTVIKVVSWTREVGGGTTCTMLGTTRAMLCTTHTILSEYPFFRCRGFLVIPDTFHDTF